MNKSPLKVNDFTKIDEYFCDIKLKSNLIDDLIRDLNQAGDIIIVGGAIRDILIKNEKPRDIDLIIDTTTNLERIFDKYKDCLRNRFGGYKLRIDEIEFDIWSIENHWAFKEKILRKNVSNLKYSTFLNFDSIFYNLTKRNIDSELFNQCILDNMLEITLKDAFIELNPSQEINILRMLLIRDEWDLSLSEKCTNYINRWLSLNKNPVESLYEAQFKHYKFEKATMKFIKNVISELI